MGLNLGRWLKYAQAKMDRSVADSNDELDELEAERAAEVADRPWLASDAQAPTFDEAKARIDWEADEQRRRAAPGGDDPSPGASSRPPAPPGPPTSSSPTHRDDERPTPGDAPTPAGLPDPDDPEAAAARAELAARELASKERLEAIRAELGVDPPAEEGS